MMIISESGSLCKVSKETVETGSRKPVCGFRPNHNHLILLWILLFT